MKRNYQIPKTEAIGCKPYLMDVTSSGDSNLPIDNNPGGGGGDAPMRSYNPL